MSSGIKWACCILLVAGIGSAGDAWLRGRRIEAAAAVLDGRGSQTRDRFLAQQAGRPAASPQEAQALAALWLQQAAATPAPRRGPALATAAAQLARARTFTPAAPGIALLQVRLDLLRFGAPRPATIATLARSYRAAGFLRDEGLWRLAFAAIYYSRLPQETRRAAIAEAVWLARLDGRLRSAVDQLVAGTPLALPVELRLIS